ncbi:MAG: glycoside hydrolase family 3 C-terminal domain-containing protein [Clostridiales Family XIII bacterium]|jgi:beta-glucosidase|nr:glycoside hydrolase family 3 C-terminal domain-containing protein [Clostridiales Family XIII bacterium]
MRKINLKRVLAIFTSIALVITYIPLTPASQLIPAAEPDTAFAGAAVPVATEIYKDSSYSFEERAADLVSRMTAMEKASQVIGSMSSAIPRLGVAQYQWWNEALHGFAVTGGSGGVNVTPYPAMSDGTSYPLSNALASTWDPELYYEEVSQISDEIRERALDHKYNLTMYSPTVNLQRDPRWGRNEEGYSEDPYLTGVMGDAFVKGLEGKNFKTGELLEGYKKAVSTIKHYTANNSENNRTGPLNGGTIEGGAYNVDMRALREYYTAPYRNIIQSADVTSVMTAYSTVNAVPVSLSSYLMDTLLRQTFGFTGYITSDCDSVGAIMNHNYINPYTGDKATVAQAFAQALAHGEDLECSAAIAVANGSYWTNMDDMLSEAPQTDKGNFTENQLDVSVWRLMKTRMELGEFDPGNIYETDGAARFEAGNTIGNEEAYVNEKAGQTQARLDLADEIAGKAVVLLKNDKVSAAAAQNILPISAIPSAYTEAAPYKVAIIGQMAQNTWFGQYSSTATPPMTNFVSIENGIKDAFAVKYGKNVEVTYYRGFTDSLTALDNLVTFSEADMAAAKAADLAIVVVGTNNGTNAEGRDRTTINLPGRQAQLAAEVGKNNPNTVVVIESCGPVQVSSFDKDVKAILWSSFGGLRQGVGFGKVITGAVNPSAKTQQTWYMNVSNDGVSDIPSIYDYNLYATAGSKGRTYMYHTGDVSYPFGYGLSYTNFTYGDVTLDESTYDASRNGSFTATFTVTNSGTVEGEEIVQLYVTQPGRNNPANKQPIKRLLGFDKVNLKPGASETVSIEVKIEDLAFYNAAQDKYIVDNGQYLVQVGASSADIRKTAAFTVTGAITPVPETVTFYPNQTLGGVDDADLGIGERIVFSAGATINPRLAVAMNDESIYGWVIKNNIPTMGADPLVASIVNTPLPDGATVTWDSNNTAVVTVAIPGTGAESIDATAAPNDGNYGLQTVKPGVATITATVTYNGKTATGSFVVAVVSDVAPKDITLDGGVDGTDDDISIGYSKDIKRYSVVVPDDDSSAAGIVNVTAVSDTTATVTQATGDLPNKATVEVKHDDTKAVAEYQVGFVRPPRETLFTEDGILTAIDGEYPEEADTGTWTTVNESTANLKYTADGVVISTEKGSFAEGNVLPQNLLMQEAGGDWLAKTHITLSEALSELGQQAGIIVYDDEDNYVRFVCEEIFVPTTNSLAPAMRVYQAINGDENRIYTANIPSGELDLYLQAQKEGRTYRFAYSFDDETWTRASTQIPVYADLAIPMLGLWANNGGGTEVKSINATYEYISLHDPVLVNPRLDGITVSDDISISFNPERFDYSTPIKTEGGAPLITKVPTVGASFDDAFKDLYDIEITQAESLPGKATIKLKSAIATVYYYVVFDDEPSATTFVGGEIDEDWKILNPSATPTYRVEPGLGLRLTTAGVYMQGAGYNDLFFRPGGGTGWDVIAKVYYPVAPKVSYQLIGLYAFQDDANYFGVDVRGYNNFQRAYATTERNGAATTPYVQVPDDATAADGSMTLYYKITRRGDLYTAAYSYKDPSNEANFITVGSGEIHLVDPQIALLAAKNATVEPIAVYCEYIGYTYNGNFSVGDGTGGMLSWAFGNAVSTLRDSIPASTSTDLTLTVPSGYTVNISGGGSAVAADGRVTQGDFDIDAELTFNVTGEFDRTSSFTKTVKVLGSSAPGTRYTVTFNSNGGSDVAAQQITAGETATVPTAPTKADFTFGGWYSDEALTLAYVFSTPVTADISLYAKWNAITPGEAYTVTFNSNGGSTVAAQQVTAGEKAVRPANPTRNGYSFSGWYTSAALSTLYNFDSAVTGDISLYAGWSVVEPSGSAPGTGTIPGGGSSSSQPSSTQPPATTQPPAGTVTPAGPFAAYSDGAAVADWAQEYFARLISTGVISGRTDGSLDPKGDVTRAEFTKMVVSALHITLAGTPKVFSGDVNAGDWYKEFVDIASSRGLVQGISDAYFGANSKISRQDLCVILFRAAEAMGTPLPAGSGAAFPDDALIADYAKAAVNALKQTGIISGRTDGSFDPAAYASREETAKIICGIQDYILAASAAAAPAADADASAAADADATAAEDGEPTDVEGTTGA